MNPDHEQFVLNTIPQRGEPPYRVFSFNLNEIISRGGENRHSREFEAWYSAVMGLADLSVFGQYPNGEYIVEKKHTHEKEDIANPRLMDTAVPEDVQLLKDIDLG